MKVFGKITPAFFQEALLSSWLRRKNERKPDRRKTICFQRQLAIYYSAFSEFTWQEVYI